jgi:membrane protein
MFTPFILLGRRVHPRVLVPGGVATAILLTAFNLGSRVYLPESTTTNVQRYGLVGVTFTILTWLFAFSLMLIVSAASGAVLAERRFGWTPDQARTAPDADVSDR